VPEVTARSVWALARRAVAYELSLYRSLARWVARRPDVRGEGVEPVGYARMVTPVTWLWIFGSAAEIPVAHLLVPWEPVRIALLVVGAWGLVWMVGLLASLHVYPHLVGPRSLRVRHGATVDIEVPWDAVYRVSHRRRDLPSTMRRLQPRETGCGTEMQVGVSGEVNVHMSLKRPIRVPTATGEVEVCELSFLADDPRELVVRASRLVASHSAGSGSHPG
jgi:hypothetical protein